MSKAYGMKNEYIKCDISDSLLVNMLSKGCICAAIKEMQNVW